MRRLIYFSFFALLVFFLASCSSKLKSEGNSLDQIVKAGKGSIGKTYTLSLDQVNIERNREGAYVRLFDSTNKTIFVYVPKNLKNKIANLEKQKYIYKFKITKNEKYTTLSGKLIDVAGLDGKPISNSLKDAGPNAKLIILDGPEAHGKTFTLSLVYKSKGESDGKKNIRLQSTGLYGKEVICNYSDDLSKKVDELKESQKCKVKLKVDKTDWRIFGTALSIE